MAGEHCAIIKLIPKMLNTNPAERIKLCDALQFLKQTDNIVSNVIPSIDPLPVTIFPLETIISTDKYITADLKGCITVSFGAKFIY